MFESNYKKTNNKRSLKIIGNNNHVELLSKSVANANKVKNRIFSYKLHSQHLLPASILTNLKTDLKNTKTNKRKFVEIMEKVSSSSIASSTSSLLKRQIAQTNLTMDNLNIENNLNCTSTSSGVETSLASTTSLMCATCLENVQQCSTCLICDCQEHTTSTAITQFSFLFGDDNQEDLLSSTPNHNDKNINRFKLPSFKYTTSDKKIKKLVKDCYFLKSSLKSKSDKLKLKINANTKKEKSSKLKISKQDKQNLITKRYSVRNNNKRAKHFLPRTSSSNDLFLRLKNNKQSIVNQNQLSNNLIYQGSFYSNNIYNSNENNFKNFGDFLVWYV
jgi:hypothetical protein